MEPEGSLDRVASQYPRERKELSTEPWSCLVVLNPVSAALLTHEPVNTSLLFV